MNKHPILLATLFCAALLGLAARPAAAEHFRMPNVVGQPEDRAIRQLEELGLRVHVHDVADAAPGQVVDQEPAAGEDARSGDEAALYVGALVRIDTRVPDVVGWPAPRAQRALEGAYEVEIEEVRGRGAQRGTVVATVPAPGSYLVFRGRITLRVAVSRRTILVPRVTGLPYQDAERVLVGRGFVPMPQFVPGRAAAWTVIRQDPAGGTQAEAGTPVELQVSLPARPTPTVRVPNLHGMDERQVTLVLTSLGLGRRVEHAPAPFETGHVYRQDPEPGAAVTRGTVVQVWIASRPRGGRRPGVIPVPSVLGIDPAQARVRLAAIGLDAALVEIDAPGRPLDEVLEQEPAAGARVPLGTAVELRVATVVEVPEVVGLTPEQAQQALTAAGLLAQMEGRGGGALQVGAQEPVAGTRVAKGSTVRVVLSVNPGRRMTPVPDLVGMSVEEANALLVQVGLVGRFQGPPMRPGAATRVASQEPVAGSRVPRGTEVRATFTVVRR